MAFSGYGVCSFHPILTRLLHLTKVRSTVGVQPAWVLACGEDRWEVVGLAALTHRPWPALAPVLLHHGDQVPEGQLLRLQHTALLHAHRLWLRRLLRERLRLPGPMPHGPDSGGVPAHREAQGGIVGHVLPWASHKTCHPYVCPCSSTPCPGHTQPRSPPWLFLSPCRNSVSAAMFPMR